MIILVPQCPVDESTHEGGWVVKIIGTKMQMVLKGTLWKQLGEVSDLKGFILVPCRPKITKGWVDGAKDYGTKMHPCFKYT